jgi:ammonia channel protein AmtB
VRTGNRLEAQRGRYGNATQLGDQALAALVAPAYAFGATFALLKLMGRVSPLRVTAEEEALGMDIVSHGEEAYPTGEGTILVEPIGASVPERTRRQPAVASAASR